MTLDGIIIKTVSPVVKPVVPNLYTGESVRYCTFNYSEMPEGIGDNAAHLTRAVVQVHYFAPLRESTIKTRHALRDVIAAVDNFTLPSIENATDETGQHYVLEFDAVGSWEAKNDG
nr:MAG TPA: hypothetical protein [Caudoviricetes sp.]